MRRISLAFAPCLCLPGPRGRRRPHDVELLLEPNGATQEAMVQRLVHLGFEVRVELVRDDGEVLSAQLTREQVEALELLPGQIVYVKPTRQTIFADS